MAVTICEDHGKVVGCENHLDTKDSDGYCVRCGCIAELCEEECETCPNCSVTTQLPIHSYTLDTQLCQGCGDDGDNP